MIQFYWYCAKATSRKGGLVQQSVDRCVQIHTAKSSWCKSNLVNYSFRQEDSRTVIKQP
jgi:hypothetical protein